MKQKIDVLLADYASYHQTKGNVYCHFVGIPLIIYGIFGMLLEVRIFGGVTAAEVLIVLAGIYYFVLDARLAVVMLFSSVLLDAAARNAADYRYAIAAFIAGWIFQGIGHIKYEKKSPAFLKNLVHLLIGPIFLINEALHFRPVETADSAILK